MSSYRSYEEIMGFVDDDDNNNNTKKNNSNNNTIAIKALSNRLNIFRKWLINDVKATVHPAVCIVNGEATDGTKNAPVLIIDRQHQQKSNNNKTTSTATSTITSNSTANNNATTNSNNSNNMEERVGIIDTNASFTLYDKTMGCQIRTVREMKQNDVMLIMPRYGMITPDVIAASDIGKIILSCCEQNNNNNNNNNNDNTSNYFTYFWNTFENTTICEKQYTNKILRSSNGTQLLVKILQERKKAETAYKKKIQQIKERKFNNNNNNNNTYQLAKSNTISTRAPYLLFLIQQRFSNCDNPLVRSESEDDISILDNDSSINNAYNYIIQQIKSNNNNNNNNIQLQDGTPKSFSPYVRTLPSSISIPLCWKREGELAFLASSIAGTPILHNVAIMTQQLVYEFITLLNAGILERFPTIFTSPDIFTFDKYVWAAAIFTSRILPSTCYYNNGNDNGEMFLSQIINTNTNNNKLVFQSPPHIWDELGILIPLLDMLNHDIDNGNQITWQQQQQTIIKNESNNGDNNNDNNNDNSNNKEKENVQYHLPRAILHKKVRKGLEIFTCYGANYNNMQLIIQYGFAQIGNINDEIKLGWSLTDAVGKIIKPYDYTPPITTTKTYNNNNNKYNKYSNVYESNDESAINAWWTEERLALLEKEIFSGTSNNTKNEKKNVKDTFTLLKAGKKMTVTAYNDETFHPYLLSAAIVATMPIHDLHKLFINNNNNNTLPDKNLIITISKKHQHILKQYLQFLFTRKLEKLLQNLDNGLKAHFQNINLWTKASHGGLHYDGTTTTTTTNLSSSSNALDDDNNNNNNTTTKYIGWQSLFDIYAYKTAMEVENRYYAMGVESCILTLYDGQLRALQSSLDCVIDDTKFYTIVCKQIEELGYIISNDEEEEEEENENEEEEEEKRIDNTNTNTNDATAGASSSSPIMPASPPPPNGENNNNNNNNNNGRSPRNRKRGNRKSSNNNYNYNNEKSPVSSSSPRQQQQQEADRPPAVKLHVGNLSYSTTPSDLYDYFSSIYGQDNVLECHIPIERDTGKSRGFGFVAMPEGIASKALESGKKHEVDGRVLKIAKSNSAGTSTTKKPYDGPPPVAGDRCLTCGYRPKYCTCQAPNLPAYSAAAAAAIPPHGPPPPPPPGMMRMGPPGYDPPPPPPPPPHLDYGHGRDYGYYGHSASADWYRNDDYRRRDYYDDAGGGGGDRYYDRRSSRYEDDYSRRSYDREDDYYRSRRSSSRGSSRRRGGGDHEEKERSSSRRSRRGESDDYDRSRKRSRSRSRDKSRRKKSKRRNRSRSPRSHSASPM